MATKKKKKKWSGKVGTSWSPPPGLFTMQADVIADTLESESGSCAQAMSRLNFYINRAGKNLQKRDRTRLTAAKLILEHRCSTGR
jgi:hypothetical protein